MYKAEVIDFSDLDQETFAPARSEYTPTTGDGLTTDETCYSTDVTKACETFGDMAYTMQMGTAMSYQIKLSYESSH